MNSRNSNDRYSTYERDYIAWYKRCAPYPGLPFDPSSFVEAIRAQYPERPLLADAFARCTREWPESELYTCFIHRYERGTRSKYAGGFQLQHPTWGWIIVDLIHDPAVPEGIRISGIEYLDRVMDDTSH